MWELYNKRFVFYFHLMNKRTNIREKSWLSMLFFLEDMCVLLLLAIKSDNLYKLIDLLKNE